MPSFKIDFFGGIAPKVNDANLEDNLATVADNCRVDRGVITALLGTTVIATISNTARSIYRFLNNWLWWTAYGVDVIKSPVPNDKYNRLYWTGNKTYPQYMYGENQNNVSTPSAINIPQQPNSPDNTAITCYGTVTAIAGNTLISSSGLTSSNILTGAYLYEKTTSSYIGQVFSYDELTITLVTGSLVNYTGEIYASTLPDSSLVKSGTISVNAGSAIVKGIGTTFVGVGYYVIAASSREIIGQIKSITNNTSLTLYKNAATTYYGVNFYIVQYVSVNPDSTDTTIGTCLYRSSTTFSCVNAASYMVGKLLLASDNAIIGYIKSVATNLITIQYPYTGHYTNFQGYIADSKSNQDLSATVINNLSGTITTSSTSNGVTGTGTSFNAGLVGKYLIDTKNNINIGLIQNYNSPTSLTLSANATESYSGNFTVSTVSSLILYQYIATYVDVYGQESPSSISAANLFLWETPDQRIITTDDAISPNSANIQTIRLYRSKIGYPGTFYKLADVIYSQSWVYSDLTPDSSLGILYSAPPLSAYTRYYMQTFIDNNSNEGLPSPVSSIASTTGEYPFLFFTDSSASYVYRRIYRSTDGLDFYQVIDVEASNTKFIDNIGSTGSLYVAPGLNPAQTITNNTFNPQGFRLGIPAPLVAPSVAVSGTGTGPTETRYYLYTYVSPIGEEGPPSLISSENNWQSGQSVTITFTAESGLTDYNLSGTGARRRLYRTNTSVTGASYQFVYDIPIGTLTYNDTVSDASLAEILPSTNWYAPPLNMIGIKMHPASFAVGFAGNTIYVSEIELPHAWNPANQLALQGNISVLGISGDSIIAMTDLYPYLITGTSPDTLTAIKIDTAQTCISKQSMADLNGTLMFASPDGLVSVVANNMNVASLFLLTQQQWQAFNPSSIRGFYHEGFYIGFSDNQVFMFDIRGSNPVLTTVSGLSYIAGYNDLTNDNLCLLDTSGNIVSWETGAAMGFTWQSKPFRLPEYFTPAAIRIYGENPISVTLTADGNQVFSGTISDNSEYRLPSGYMAKQFQLKLTGNGRLESVSLATSISELE